MPKRLLDRAVGEDGDDAADALRKTTIDEFRRGRGVPLSL
jgi:hypothetical protein